MLCAKQRLTVLEAAFILETEFIQLTAAEHRMNIRCNTTLQGSNTFIGFGQAGLRPAL
jgi:hypothetical protein